MEWLCEETWTPAPLTILWDCLNLASFYPPCLQSRISLREIVNAGMSTRCQRGVTPFLIASCFMIHSFLCGEEEEGSCGWWVDRYKRNTQRNGTPAGQEEQHGKVRPLGSKASCAWRKQLLSASSALAFSFSTVHAMPITCLWEAWLLPCWLCHVPPKLQIQTKRWSHFNISLNIINKSLPSVPRQLSLYTLESLRFCMCGSKFQVLLSTSSALS